MCVYHYFTAFSDPPDVNTEILAGQVWLTSVGIKQMYGNEVHT